MLKKDERTIQGASPLRRRCNSRGQSGSTAVPLAAWRHTHKSESEQKNAATPCHHSRGLGFPMFPYRIEVAFWHKHQLSDCREGCQLLLCPGPCAERARKNASPSAVLIPRTLLLQTETSNSGATSTSTTHRKRRISTWDGQKHQHEHQHQHQQRIYSKCRLSTWDGQKHQHEHQHQHQQRIYTANAGYLGGTARNINLDISISATDLASESPT